MNLILLPGTADEYMLSIYLNADNHMDQIAEAVGLINDAITDKRQISHISFYNSVFSKINKEQLSPLFRVIKKAGVKSLGLAAINLNRADQSKIQELFSLVSDVCENGTVEKIEFNKNTIGNGSLEQQQAIIQGLLKIVPHIQELDLSFNNLETIQANLLSDLLVGCAKSKLRKISLDYNCLVQESDDLGWLYLLCEGRVKSKWEHLSLSGIDLICLSNNGWSIFLQNIEKCCESINLSYNALHEQTNEGQLEISSQPDLIQIIADWLKITNLTMINLAHNKFSVRNTELLEQAVKVGTVLITEGNNLPNSIDYEKLLEQTKEDIESSRQEHGIDQYDPQSGLFYMHKTLDIPEVQPNILVISSLDLEEQVAVFMQNLAKKNPLVSQKISAQEIVTAVTDILVSHEVRVAPVLSEVSNIVDTANYKYS